MSYHIYTTPSIVLKRVAFGESDTVLYVLTRDLGLIIASAKSTRLIVSKLRNSLQEYSLVNISCVKGKNGWKITNSGESRNLFFDCPVSHRKVLSQISSVLVKNIVGEFPQKEIFEMVKESFSFLENIKEEDLKDFEILTVLRLMKELGYVAVDEEFKKYFDSSSPIEAKVSFVKNDRLKLVGIINKALKESQL